MMRLKLIVLLVICLLLAGTSLVEAQDLTEEILEGQVVEVVDVDENADLSLPSQELHIDVDHGSLQGSQIIINNEASYTGADLSEVNYQTYQVGDRLRIYSTFNDQNERLFVIDGLVRRSALLWLSLLFALAVILVAGKFGALSLLALVLSFLIIVKILLPMILAGRSPVLASLISSLLIIPGTFYLAHGFNQKTHSGVVATTIALFITALLAKHFIAAAHLTGFASEEAGLLSVMTGGQIDILALLFAGMIIGVLGVLDDVTIGQASVVEQLRIANPELDSWSLFWQSMRVGQDHVSSMINTLILVYTGSSLPLMMLFMDSSRSFIDVIELEVVAEEVVRTLVSSLGLMLAVPLTSLLSVFVFKPPAVED